MRLRKVPGADEAVAAHVACIDIKETETAGRWAELFGNTQPLYIEIGMGKGQFIMEMAAQNPDINFVGIERYTSVLYRALQKYDQDPLQNLRFVCMDAAEITEVFAPKEVDRIFLNFSDPWPKDRHAKRRLTSSAFLGRFEQILEPDGMIEFKTDNQDLFTFSLEQAEDAGWELLAVTRDLHHEASLNEGNIMTEYEERFSAQGNPICKMVITKRS